jgi:ligand-binding SRPBCC domain-containing protein
MILIVIFTYQHNMALHTLKSTQFIQATIEELWDFFSSPLNLATITPPYMKFRITSEYDTQQGLYEGQIITYKVSPLLSIPLSWTTEITKVVKHSRFIDEQKKGPYKLWRHEHTFQKQDGGTMMTDLVNYSLPFSILGEVAHTLFVQKQLKEIFTYRKEKIDQLFNKA